jgi:ATP-dependent Clp protease ATP-binding subunit ClpA
MVPNIQLLNAPFFVESWLQERSFTRDASLVLAHSVQRASSRGMLGVIPPSIVLWSIIRWEKKLGISILESCGANSRFLEEEIEADLTRQPSHGQLVMDFDEVSKIALAAYSESRKLGYKYVGTEHLIWALLLADDGFLRSLFEKHALTREHYLSVLGETERTRDSDED